MAQPAQPNAGGKKKFNWKGLIIGIIVLAIIAVLIAWAAGAFSASDDSKHISMDYFMTHHLNTAGRGGGLFQSGITASTNGHYLAYDFGTPGHTQHYIVDVDLHTWREATTGQTGSNANNYIQVLHKLTTNDFQASAHIDKAGKIFDHIEYHAQSTGSKILGIFLRLLPVILIIGVMVWMMKGSGSMGGSGSPFGAGKNPAKKITSNKKFKDVAGLEEAKEEVREVVDFLKRPAKYKAAGARIPKGIMLGGPPGTGKTLLAKAVAGEAGIPFYFISASNFVEMFAGMGAKRVREMFKEARKNAPAILFIDEMDAVGRKRGSSMSGNDEREQTLNQILVEMDGIVESNGLLVISATNRPDVLDPALTRPGRFDRTITVGLPDIKEREMILKLHATGKRISPEIDFANIAKRTPSYSGADLEAVINESTLLSVREGTEIVTPAQIDEAIDRVMAGPAKKHRIITAEENKLVAIHEAGHAVVGLKVEDADIVQKITIIPRGDAGGYTLTIPKKEQYNSRQSQLESRIMGYLGGRAAEQVYFGEVTTGGSDDIQKATNIARAMVTQFGMSILGPIAYEKPRGSQHLGMDGTTKEYSDALAERIDEAIRILIVDAEKKAVVIIKKHRKLLDLIVEELLSKETIVVEEIDYINKHLKRPPKKVIAKKKDSKHKSLDELINEVESDKTQTTKVEKKKTVAKKTTAKKPVAKKTTTKKSAVKKDTTKKD